MLVGRNNTLEWFGEIAIRIGESVGNVFNKSLAISSFCYGTIKLVL